MPIFVKQDPYRDSHIEMTGKLEPPFAEADSLFCTTATTGAGTLLVASALQIQSAATPTHPAATGTQTAALQTHPPASQIQPATSQSQQPLAANTVVLNPYSPFQLYWPAAYRDSNDEFCTLDAADNDAMNRYIRRDLDLSRLLRIHRHLWLAGLPKSARPLHHQLLMERDVIMTERADLHLTWTEKRLFLKRLPEYLMDYTTWKNTLCQEKTIFMEASGLLLSYMWLIASQSDLRIAHDAGLLPREITWSLWTRFSRACLTGLDHKLLTTVSPRYVYGELRLSRLNTIYRLCASDFKTLVRGYRYGYSEYSNFVERNFAWFLTAIIYITVVLTALQVGLGTDQLKTNHSFMRASYGFTVFSILAPLILGTVVVGVLLVLVLWNGTYALKKRKSARKTYKQLFDDAELLHHRASRE